MEKSDLLTLLRSNNTVFTFKEILLASRETRPELLRRRICYYVSKGELYPIRRGLYAKDKNYNRLEVAVKILTPAYVSFETVLGHAGIIFQQYAYIFSASYQTKELLCDGQGYRFRRIKDRVLTQHAGIESKNGYTIAAPERAFLDVLYLNKDYHFDNLEPLDWKKVFDILPIYGGNKRMGKKVRALHRAREMGRSKS